MVIAQIVEQLFGFGGIAMSAQRQVDKRLNGEGGLDPCYHHFLLPDAALGPTIFAQAGSSKRQVPANSSMGQRQTTKRLEQLIEPWIVSMYAWGRSRTIIAGHREPTREIAANFVQKPLLAPVACSCSSKRASSHDLDIPLNRSTQTLEWAVVFSR